MTCVECGEELLAERARLGYDYCTGQQCQARHRTGVAVTAVAVNKSGDSFLVADPDEIARRAEGGGFAAKDTGLGVGYRPPPSAAARPRTSPSPPSRGRRRRPWTTQQERLVRLYHGMGLSPRAIVERARETAPRLGVTESLVTAILCSPPPRQR